MAITRKPRQSKLVPKDYIPPNSTAYKVKTGDSLKKIAKRVKLTWQELAEYNWKTTFPAEINWYLGNYVGCTAETRDGQNYSFRDSDSPGMIYIPLGSTGRSRVTKRRARKKGHNKLRPTRPPIIVMKIPLGKARRFSKAKYRIGKIYVPTKWGGRLTVHPSAGKAQLFYKNGQDIDEAIQKEILEGQHSVDGPAKLVDYEVPQNKHGWYYVRIRRASSAVVFVRFVQEGKAKDSDNTDLIPWNFWYFPFSDHGPAPHAWTSPGPFTRFDSRFGTKAFDWEVKKHYRKGAAGWTGHCHGAVRAAILFKQPETPNPNPEGFKQEDLELFATEYCLNHCHRLVLWGLPGGRMSAAHVEIPAKGPGMTNRHVGKFHEALVDVLLVKRDACYVDFRASPPTVDPSDPDYNDHLEAVAIAVWNQSVYKFKAEFSEHPESEGNEKDILVSNSITANEDNGGENNGDPETGAKQERTAKYRIIFKTDGNIDNTNSYQDWEAVEDAAGKNQFAPRYIMRPIDFSRNWAGQGNPEVKYTNLSDLDIKRRKKYATKPTP
jgi:hypothetical protein